MRGVALNVREKEIGLLVIVAVFDADHFAQMNIVDSGSVNQLPLPTPCCCGKADGPDRRFALLGEGDGLLEDIHGLPS